MLRVFRAIIFRLKGALPMILWPVRGGSSETPLIWKMAFWKKQPGKKLMIWLLRKPKEAIGTPAGCGRFFSSARCTQWRELFIPEIYPINGKMNNVIHCARLCQRLHRCHWLTNGSGATQTASKKCGCDGCYSSWSKYHRHIPSLR